jgi:ribosomal protection tetracycline resistance protein
VLNLGILAHVDAGKTSLTERLLFECGAISHIGSVDEGTTQTDSDAIERARGITVRSAVACFRDGDRQYNLVDTPGHADFVAEVERALMAVDAVILVISAPEGVQPQTRTLYHVIQRLRLPTIVFVNKIDCVGAADVDLMDELSGKLGLLPIAMGFPVDPGTPEAVFVPVEPSDIKMQRQWAECLAENDENILAQLVADQYPGRAELLESLRAQTNAGLVQPVVFGSSITGAGIVGLRLALRELLEPPAGGADLSACVFAIGRNERGERRALVRCFGGVLAEREQVDVHQADDSPFRGRIRSLEVVAPDGEGGRRLTAGHIASIGGLARLRIGDRLGLGEAPPQSRQFPPPGLEVAVRPADPMNAPALRAALVTLADQDPMIRADLGPDGESIVHLYGHVQQEVLQQTLAEDFGVKAMFALPNIIHLERPMGTGSAVEMIGNGFLATVGLRAEPGKGVSYRREVELGALPVAFHDAVEEAVKSALSQGCYGWRVVDIKVTMTHCGFWARPFSAARDFRDVTPHVLMQALAQAGTKVYEPTHRFWVELPEDSFGAVINFLNSHEAEIEACREEMGLWVIEGRIPLRVLAEVRQRLLSLTGGRASWTSYADGDKAVAVNPPPRRTRTDGNPFDRAEYMMFLANR